MNEVGYANSSDTAERRTVLFSVPTSCGLREQENGRKLECIVEVILDYAMLLKLKQFQGFQTIDTVHEMANVSSDTADCTKPCTQFRSLCPRHVSSRR